MKPWKAILGMGAACVACCTVPLLAGAAGFTAASATLAAAGAAMLRCAEELKPLAFVLLVVAGLVVGGAGATQWLRHSPPKDASTAKPCGCKPGTCG